MKAENVVNDVEHVLQSDTRLRNAPLSVSGDESGVISLGGQVDSYSEKIIAEEITIRIRGVRDVVNTITVMPRQVRSDEYVTDLVRKNLKLDVWVEWAKINVETIDGIVFLRGIVNSGSQKQEAEYAARWIAGVVDVVNHITVKPETQIGDAEIARDIRAALQKNSRLDLTEIEIDVTDGVATLTGQVPNFTQKRLAEFIAFSVPGIVDTINELYIPIPQRRVA